MEGSALVALSQVQWTMLVVMAILFVGVVVGFYTRTGSEIGEHPRGARRGEPQRGAEGRSEVSGKDAGEPPAPRGTR